MMELLEQQIELTAYFVGLNWQDMFQADDRIGLAFGQPTKRNEMVKTVKLIHLLMKLIIHLK